MMKRSILGFLFALWSSIAAAQGCGPANPNCIVPTAPPGTNNNQAASTAFVTNATGSISGVTITGTAAAGNVPVATSSSAGVWESFSLGIDASIGSTRGSVLERGAASWGIITPGTSGLPWISNGAGADPAYQAITNVGHAAMTQNAVKGAASSTAVADLSIPSCSTTASALQWTTNTGFSCRTGLPSWAAFTPTPTCGTATITTNSARFSTSNKTTAFQLDFTITAIGTCTTTVSFTAPNTANSSGSAIMAETTVNAVMGVCNFSSGSATVGCSKNALANFVVNEHHIVSGVYENQ